MKTKTVKKLAILAITLATAGSVTRAFAHVPQGEQTPSAPIAQSARTNDAAGAGLTRAQVRAELVQAEEAGEIPVRSPDYPPSARTIERNRVRFALAEQAWKGHSNVSAQ
jgi:Domain of unknown function (DUF4148)